MALVSQPPPELLIIVFIHGFKGTDSTFGPFPERLRHVLGETIDNVIVESIVFPAYETKGELDAAVGRFADWLVTLTVEREVAHGSGGGAGRAKIVLCGHSMGGLLAADTLIQMVNSRPDMKAPLWPRIIALLAFDTPYLGLHPFVFRNSASKATQYVQTARDILSFASSFKTGNPGVSAPVPTAAPAGVLPAPRQAAGWSKWALPAAYAVGGTVLAGAAAGAAYMRKDDIGQGYAWAADHMKYVGNLWQEDKLRARMEEILKIEQELGVVFRTWYTLLPPLPSHDTPRTFIVLPKPPPVLKEAHAPASTSAGDSALAAEAHKHFVPAKNSLAEDEVQAHTSMFEAKTNDGYYELGLQTAKVIREALMATRGQVSSLGGMVVEDQDYRAEKERDRNAGMKLQESMGDDMMGQTRDDSQGTTRDIDSTASASQSGVRAVSDGGASASGQHDIHTSREFSEHGNFPPDNNSDEIQSR
ncbi:hypothetical protein PUNSTDRAFT_125531 [Punctularia strigosozonata HHB-11173 SS5]|uniref:uncharacterized protein n=1 Tax=Punctularia strigosozonata (strain HHB-11173) TaxID=741275 RepID=UPI00044185A4|nr:uncharacterized protein PUNSTDRAFT_125531 [Punctularia strigosozonata HHB-11173 SS5]EIN10898.1 hypothetical protein PUNSTDRAFT_125531 [Punctularia strigosozonata HHB-11173 SS5]